MLFTLGLDTLRGTSIKQTRDAVGVMSFLQREESRMGSAAGPDSHLLGLRISVDFS